MGIQDVCVSAGSGHRALRVFLQGQGGVKGAGRADGVQCVALCSLPALLGLWAVFSFGGSSRGARGAPAVLTEVFPD